MNDLRDNADVGELIQYIVIRLGEEQFGIALYMTGRCLVGDQGGAEEVTAFDPFG